ncbi:MAG: methionine--tRNA ligase subunit beta [Candidatus Nealsonbacteria bacterium]
MKNINFEEFQKIDLRIAKVISAEKIKGSEKLLKLELDLGKEKRQIITGVSEFYQPKDLIGREIVVVANLEPKTLMGLESQGMLLAADVNGEAVLLRPDKEIPPRTKIR